ncbi:hypothetical protein HMPREF0373_00077 [Eubacterium ramulus ATCC 29099]|uniref:Uncharacterized protein n=1 Tax=Eubacterium ramulus ATCC 29099 TaxID=1256908 RepID=U2Q933_EUBRA|nr:hypothetical protein HMPREF0373_00077 [Eubacterium ramulus ATCC 29099]
MEINFTVIICVERMRQGNARIIVIHPFVFGLIIFLSLLVESDG